MDGLDPGDAQEHGDVLPRALAQSGEAGLLVGDDLERALRESAHGVAELVPAGADHSALGAAQVVVSEGEDLGEGPVLSGVPLAAVIWWSTEMRRSFGSEDALA